VLAVPNFRAYIISQEALKLRSPPLKRVDGIAGPEALDEERSAGRINKFDEPIGLLVLEDLV
jgi:hypothetical protein